LDLIYVAVPPKFHHKIVLDVIAAGKHVLCEKPLANSVQEAQEMWESAQHKGVVHALNFPLHYSAEVREMARLLVNERIGRLRRLELITHFPLWPRRWQQNEWVGGREQGGFILEVGVHFIQTIQRLFGGIQSVHSQVEYPANSNDCETGVIATMALTDGTPILFSGLSQIPGEERVEFHAYGTEGKLSLLNWGTLVGASIGESATSIEPTLGKAPDLIGNLVQAIRGHDADLCDFGVGYKAQMVLEQLRG
jgi:predicted dehydrogenase